MTKLHPDLSPEILAELSDIAGSQGCELAHAEFKGGVLRLVLDRLEGGVNLSDCEAVSKLSSAYLDVVDFGQGRYTLEVSSPGLDRPLYGPKDYQRFTGSKVRITYLTEAGTKRTTLAKLISFAPEDGGCVEIEIEKEGLLRLPLHRVKLTRLEVEL